MSFTTKIKHWFILRGYGIVSESQSKIKSIEKPYKHMRSNSQQVWSVKYCNSLVGGNTVYDFKRKRGANLFYNINKNRIGRPIMFLFSKRVL
ncbi:MAG: hypothetical protein FWE50_03610 [Alphaproteobacteria bacterium]|nr:hypothetical protein [Alphaproteobacteria bacterium]